MFVIVCENGELITMVMYGVPSDKSVTLNSIVLLLMMVAGCNANERQSIV